MNTPAKIQSDPTIASPNIVNLRCPVCGERGAFHGFDNILDLGWRQFASAEEKQNKVTSKMRAGVRQCPTPGCHGLVFVVIRSGELWKSYPPEVIDFDASNIPDGIKQSLEEAIQCHASGCHKASALMVRRTLEELCADRSAAGKNLEKRIEALRASIVIPEELFEAMHELRFLGNDAAHIEARAFDDVGSEESDLAIEVTKELLKAVYQMSSLVKRLKSLKKTES